MMAAAQALDIRGKRLGKGTGKAHEIIRKHVDYLDEDRPLYKDHNTMQTLLESNEILEGVEAHVGKLN